MSHSTCAVQHEYRDNNGKPEEHECHVKKCRVRVPRQIAGTGLCIGVHAALDMLGYDEQRGYADALVTVGFCVKIPMDVNRFTFVQMAFISRQSRIMVTFDDCCGLGHVPSETELR
jgi:hypothetical protein